MDDHQLEIRPKKWFKYFMYFCGIFGAAMGAFNLYLMTGSPITLDKIQNGDILSICVLAVSIALVLFMPLAIPHYQKMKVFFGSDELQQQSLVSKTIPYNDINKITVGNGIIEIHGDGFLNKIAFGNLYTNFDSAVEMLSKKVKEVPSITFRGNNKYRQKYFEAG